MHREEPIGHLGILRIKKERPETTLVQELP